MTSTPAVRAFAHANIALIKYWGKFNLEHNIPLVSSLSLTLDSYGTTTKLLACGDEHDSFILNGEGQLGLPAIKVQRFLDFVRMKTDKKQKFIVESSNNFPTKSGLASSASGFAALALAACTSLDWELSKKDLSRLARRGSASAARSIFGNLALLHGGVLSDEQAYAEEISEKLAVRLIIAQCSTAEKDIASTDGMNASSRTSPFFPVFVDQQPKDIDDALLAIATNDVAMLGEIMEYSTLKMHSCCFSAFPGFWYWNESTISVMNAVKKLRKQGATAYFTMDAGPHVKILCPSDQCADIMAELKGNSAITQLDQAGPGRGAYLLDEPQI